MERADFEDELERRGIPVYRPTLADLHDDLAAIKALGS
jgi:predicted HTH domain antitoxin